MADNRNGHWYTDKNGNHYFVENGQSPKEGWEQSKRRKMIDGGKYKVDDADGKGAREVSREEWEKYEADDDFDATTDDDFGFDESEDNVADDANQYFDEVFTEMRKNGIDMGDNREILQELGANYGMDRDEQEEFMKYMYGENYDQRFEGAQTWGQREKPEIDYGDLVEEDQELFVDQIKDHVNLNDIKQVEYMDEDPEGYDGGYAVTMNDGSTRYFGWHSGQMGLEEVESGDNSDAYDFEGEVNEILDRLKNESGMYYDARSFAEQKLKDYSPKAREEALRRFAEKKNKSSDKIGNREIPYTAGEIEDEDNEEYLKGKSGPQTANIDANVDEIAKEVASKFGEANVKVGENGHILLKDPEGFDPVAIADEDEIPAGAIVKIMPNWREPNENPDDTYFVKEDRGDRLLLWSPSKSSSFGGYTYEWPKNTMYIPPRMRQGKPSEGKPRPVEKQGSEGQKTDGSSNPKASAEKQAKPNKTDEQKKAAMKAKAKAKRDKEIRSMGKEIVEYYNGDPIDEDEVADILAGEYGYNQRMVNAILKWVKENQ